MGRRWTLQDTLAMAAAVLVAWGFAQLAATYGLALWTALAPGLVAAAGLLAWHLRARAAGEPPGSRAVDPLRPSRAQAAGALAGILAVGLVLRIHTLLLRPAWDDEMWTLRNMYTSDWGELLRVAFDDYWPPLYYLVLNALARVGDTSLLWLRSPSVVFGVATLALMYPLGLRLFRHRGLALVGVALLTGTTSHVLYSQEARVYSFQVLLAVLSAYYFYTSYWERRVSPGFVAATCMLTYSHSFASWYFVAAGSAYVVLAWVLWRDGEALRKGLLSQLLVVLLWLPLVGAFVHARYARDIVVPTHWASAPEDPAWIAGLVEQYQGLAVRSWAGAALMALLLALAVGRALAHVARARGGEAHVVHDGAEGAEGALPPDPKGIVFLVCWTAVPVLFSMGVSAFTALDTFGEIRYHLTVLPGICLLAAAGFGEVRSRAAVSGLLAMLVLVPAADLPRYYRDFTRPAMDEAARIVKAEGRSGEPVYVSGGYRAFAYYYRGVFPRIGSEQWDSLAAATADLVGEYTLESVKWGDTYAYEKLPRNVRHFTYFNPPPHHLLTDFVRWEVERGGLRGPFWVVQNDPPFTFQDLLSEPGYECRNPREFAAHALRIVYCNPPDGGPEGASGQPGSDPAPEVRLEGGIP